MVKAPKQTVAIKMVDVRTERKPLRESLDFCVLDFTAPQPDIFDPWTAAVGVLHRAARLHLRSADLFGEFRAYVIKILPEVVALVGGCLSPDHVITRDNWLDGTAYPRYRKDELRREVPWFNKRGSKVDGFVKDETYGGFKHARGIYARRDWAKAFFGPFFAAIEKRLKLLPCFVKTIAVAERAGIICQRLIVPGRVFVETDYSSYESTFDHAMTQIERLIYAYMLKDHPKGAEFLDTFDRVINDPKGNTVFFRHFVVKGLFARMSGEMSTSIGNGIMNMFMCLFMMHRSGVHWKDMINQMFVEGDDGIFSCLPHQVPNSDIWNLLGCKIEMVVSTSIEDTDFCSQIFDSTSHDTLCDPIKVLANFGWSNSRYVGAKRSRLLELLRAKALSYRWQYPSCPIVTDLADYVLRMTKHIDMERFFKKERRVGSYTMEWMRNAYNERHNFGPKVISSTSRFLIQKRFGVHIEEQVRVEKIFQEASELKHMFLDLAHLAPSSWLEYTYYYVNGNGNGKFHDNLVECRAHLHVVK